MTDWVEPDKLKISFDTLSDDRLSGTWQTKDIIWHTVRGQTVWNVTSRRYHLTHCQMTDCGEPDKHMISVDTPSDDGARWAWQKVTLLLLTRWTTGQETGWLCWPPEACGPQRCSLWSYSGEKKIDHENTTKENVTHSKLKNKQKLWYQQQSQQHNSDNNKM